MNPGPRSSRITVRVADTVVGLGGDHGLQRYLRMVDTLVPGRGVRARYMRAKLSYLPSPRTSVLKIRTHPASFLYESTPFDDLQFTCRRDFEEWEPVSRCFFALAAREAGHVLDVGAYSGVYSITAAIANEEASVLALEPNPLMYRLAVANIGRNGLTGRAIVKPIAAGDDSGMVRLYLPEHLSMATLVEEGDDFVEVQQEPLDALLEGQALHLMKVDVEGGESAVFRGAQETLSRWQPIILAEALSDQELLRQREILSLLGYADPVPVYPPSEHGDSRNFIWASVRDRARLERLLQEARQLAVPSRG